jgi:hypothetical protein
MISYVSAHFITGKNDIWFFVIAVFDMVVAELLVRLSENLEFCQTILALRKLVCQKMLLLFPAAFSSSPRLVVSSCMFFVTMRTVLMCIYTQYIINHTSQMPYSNSIPIRFILGDNLTYTLCRETKTNRVV